ncbi:MAG: hypothetical protein FWF28_07180, partial [Micrococcales bacterium]|nr:hypothetical protein [Micrococcales bacterium]
MSGARVDPREAKVGDRIGVGLVMIGEVGSCWLVDQMGCPCSLPEHHVGQHVAADPNGEVVAVRLNESPSLAWLDLVDEVLAAGRHWAHLFEPDATWQSGAWWKAGGDLRRALEALDGIKTRDGAA